MKLRKEDIFYKFKDDVELDKLLKFSDFDDRYFKSNMKLLLSFDSDSNIDDEILKINNILKNNQLSEEKKSHYTNSLSLLHDLKNDKFFSLGHYPKSMDTILSNAIELYCFLHSLYDNDNLLIDLGNSLIARNILPTYTKSIVCNLSKLLDKDGFSFAARHGEAQPKSSRSE